MLATQVQYWANVENRRHNLATEAQSVNELAETIRTHKVNERISQQTQEETARHNLAQETLGWFNANEVQRHNQVGERLGWSTLDESSRHNKATEGIQSRTVTETVRHNRATESIGRTQAQASVISANAAQRQAGVAERNVTLNEFLAPYTAQNLSSQTAKNVSAVGADVADMFITPFGKAAGYATGIAGAALFVGSNNSTNKANSTKSKASGSGSKTSSTKTTVYRRGSYQR